MQREAEKNMKIHTGQKASEDRSRDWSDDATSQGMPGATTSWDGQEEPPLETLEGVWHCRHLDFGLLASGAVGKYIPVFKSPSVWQFVMAATRN